MIGSRKIYCCLVVSLNVWCAWLTASAHAQDRVALVIGNDRYQNLPADKQLAKAVNDARAVGAALEKIGFTVIRGENLDRQGMIDRIFAFTKQIKPGDTAVLFYAGHGVAISGGNYLLPTDVRPAAPGEEARVRNMAIGEADIMADIQERKARVTVLMLDACRDNPFRQPGLTRSVGNSRGLGRGAEGEGVFAVYSAGFGQSALDSLGPDDRSPNSVFTRVLAPALSRTDTALSDLIIDVRESVAKLAATVDHQQYPAYYDQTRGGRVFLSGLPAKEPSVIRRIPLSNASSPTGAQFKSSREDKPLAATEIQSIGPGDVFRECRDCPELIIIPRGSFQMGSPNYEKGHSESETPAHTVTIAQDLAIGRYEVTNRQYLAFINSVANDRGFDKRWFKSNLEESTSRSLGRISSGGTSYVAEPGFDDYPVAFVSWEGAVAYTRWLSKMTGGSYRLPSEAEWEYGARGGSRTPYHFGYDVLQLCAFGNIADLEASKKYKNWRVQACSDGFSDAAPVGKFRPNDYGLFDMYGNVAEWVEDCWHANYQGAPADGSAWVLGADCNMRIVRGGSFKNMYLRSAVRFQQRIFDQVESVGFRVARKLQ